MRWTGPTVLIRFSIPRSKSRTGETTKQIADLRSRQAAHTDVDCSGVYAALDRAVGIVNVTAVQGMIDALRNAMSNLFGLKRRISFRMQTLRFRWIQLAP